MKELYEKLEMEVLELADEDVVITESPGVNDDCMNVCVEHNGCEMVYCEEYGVETL